MGLNLVPNGKFLNHIVSIMNMPALSILCIICFQLFIYSYPNDTIFMIDRPALTTESIKNYTSCGVQLCGPDLLFLLSWTDMLAFKTYILRIDIRHFI